MRHKAESRSLYLNIVGKGKVIMMKGKELGVELFDILCTLANSMNLREINIVGLLLLRPGSFHHEDRVKATPAESVLHPQFSVTCNLQYLGILPSFCHGSSNIMRSGRHVLVDATFTFS